LYSVLIFKDGTRQGDLPGWWVNFMREHGHTRGHGMDHMQEILKPYNATLRVGEPKPGREFGDRFLDFETESDAALFFLKVKHDKEIMV
jgi:hypothetical protein